GDFGPVAHAHGAVAVLVLVAPGELLNGLVASGEFLVRQVGTVAVLGSPLQRGAAVEVVDRPAAAEVGLAPRRGLRLVAGGYRLDHGQVALLRGGGQRGAGERRGEQRRLARDHCEPPAGSAKVT